MFEHLSITEAKKAILEFDRVLEPGGLVRIDVPDSEETARLLSETKDPFYIRHLFGSRKDDWGFHLMGYSREGLTGLFKLYGFEFDGEESNVHFYPAFTLRFRKLFHNRPAWEYNLKAAGVVIMPGWRVLEIGPGNFPLPRADAYCDIDAKFDPKNGKPFAIADLDGTLPYPDKSFDYLYIGHVLEHVKDPVHAAAEISRVARRGLVECPHPWREILFDFEEGDHSWLVWPPSGDDKLIFWPHPSPRASALRDSNVQGALCRIFRNGPATFEHDSILLRQWYYKNQANLATIHTWTGELNVVVEDRRV